MITLCMDTSQSFLVLALIQDDVLLDGIQETCWKRQSEELFPRLIQLLESHQLTSDDIDQIVITVGPGSYTGVRIAMTVAKVIAAMREIPLFTLGSLQLVAGKSPHVRVLMDARGHRAYHGIYDNGILQGNLEALDVDEIIANSSQDEFVAGDCHLIGKEDFWGNLPQNFLDLKSEWQPVEQVHLLVPEYLKSADAYLVKQK